MGNHSIRIAEPTFSHRAVDLFALCQDAKSATYGLWTSSCSAELRRRVANRDSRGGERMSSGNSRAILSLWITTFLMVLPAASQSFRVQCPISTITHPLTGTNCGATPTNPGCNNTEPPYNGPTQFHPASLGTPSGTSGDFVYPVTGTVNGAIKCQQISGGDGYMTEADGTQTFMFSFGPLSGLADVAAGRPSTQFPNIFNTPYSAVSTVPLTRGDPATTDGAISGAAPWPTANNPATNPLFTWNGAVGLMPDVTKTVTVSNV